jgi:hypothetical protein
MKDFDVRTRIQVLVLLLLFSLCPMAYAQITNASLSGQVSDANGAAVPGVHIRVQNTATNVTQTAKSNEIGVFTVSPLNPGPYTVTAEKTGFEKTVETGIILTVGQAATLNIALQVGDVTEVVTVSADAEMINTTTAEVGTTITDDAIKELPLNGRNPASLVQLSAGVTNILTTRASSQPSETTLPDETGASAGGGRQGSTYFMLDGAPNMDTYTRLSAPFPNPDATQEFRVVTNNFDAHYGFSPGAVVSIQTRSGSNQFHGSTFEYVRNSMFNAADYFGKTVDPLHRNTFGGGVGGPVFKNKFFFFGNYQYERDNHQATNNFGLFPTKEMLAGDFTSAAATLNNGHGGIINGPDNLFVNNKINPSLLSPGALAFAKAALPVGAETAGNPGYTQYSGSPTLYTTVQGTTRLDYNISDNQRAFLRSFIEYYDNIEQGIKGNIAAVSPGKQGRYYNEAFGHNWVINQSMVNTLNVYWTQLDVSQAGQALDSSGQPICLSRFVAVTEKAGHCYMERFGYGAPPEAVSSGFDELSSVRRTSFGFSDAFTKTIGHHTLSAGADVVHQYSQLSSDNMATAEMNFSSSWTGYSLADFLTGNVAQFIQGGGTFSGLKGWIFGLYAQDQYRVKPNLTLTAGIRWDPNTPPTVAGGRGVAWRPGQQSTRYPNAPLGEIFPGDQGVNATLMQSSYSYWEPRIGLSWQPKALPNTAIRAGFGLFTGPLMYALYDNAAAAAPFSPTFMLTDNPQAYGMLGQAARISFDNPWANFPGGNQFASGNFASLTYTPPTNSSFALPTSLEASFAPDFKLGITQSWNLSIEQKLSRSIALHVAYVGSESYHQGTVVDANAGGVWASQAADVRPYSNFSTVIVDKSLGTSSYNSLQAEFEMRPTHGLGMQSSFTWSKDVDLFSQANILSSVGTLANPFNIRWNRGISDMDVPLVSTTNLIYQSPALKGLNRIFRNILGSWEIAGIYTIESGSPFGISGGALQSGGPGGPGGPGSGGPPSGGGAVQNDDSGSLQGGDRADYVPGQIPWSHRGGKPQWLSQYFNTSAFTPNAKGTFGNTPRVVFRAPGLNFADASIGKNISVQERYKLQLRFELFNALNHASFAAPGNSPAFPNYGMIQQTGSEPARVGQLSINIKF